MHQVAASWECAVERWLYELQVNIKALLVSQVSSTGQARTVQDRVSGLPVMFLQGDSIDQRNQVNLRDSSTKGKALGQGRRKRCNKLLHVHFDCLVGLFPEARACGSQVH